MAEESGKGAREEGEWAGLAKEKRRGLWLASTVRRLEPKVEPMSKSLALSAILSTFLTSPKVKPLRPWA